MDEITIDGTTYRVGDNVKARYTMSSGTERPADGQIVSIEENFLGITIIETDRGFEIPVNDTLSIERVD